MEGERKISWKKRKRKQEGGRDEGRNGRREGGRVGRDRRENKRGERQILGFAHLIKALFQDSLKIK